MSKDENKKLTHGELRAILEKELAAKIERPECAQAKRVYKIAEEAKKTRQYLTVQLHYQFCNVELKRATGQEDGLLWWKEMECYLMDNQPELAKGCYKRAVELEPRLTDERMEALIAGAIWMEKEKKELLQ